MVIAVIDYESGNLHSIFKAVKCSEEQNGTNRDVIVTSNPDDVRGASHIVLPGVGAYGDCLKGIYAIDGMIEALNENVIEKKKPFMGICVGMQLLATTGHENGTHQGFGWIPGTVVPIDFEGEAYRIPHMGWNDLSIKNKDHLLFSGIEEGEHVYFVHSYHFIADAPEDVVASVSYGQPMTAVISNDNIVGLQFHPEKSQDVGLKIISNFLKM